MTTRISLFPFPFSLFPFPLLPFAISLLPFTFPDPIHQHSTFEMTNHQHLEKEKFQLDRIALFSDAIFAIAITLLIIEIKVPEPHDGMLSSEGLAHSLLTVIP